jgi:hypothetical protein
LLANILTIPDIPEHINVSKHVKLWKEQKYGHEFRGGRNKKRLFWRGPATIYWTGLDRRGTEMKSGGYQIRQTVKYGHESSATWSQESLFWRGPTVI